MPFASLPNVRLRYLQLPRASYPEERKDDLVLIHGLASNLGYWYFRIAPKLAADHRVTMFDLRGHGLSTITASGYGPGEMAEDLRHLLDALEIQKAHLLGHSFGGLILLYFATRYPERVRSVTLVDVRVRALQARVRLQDWPSWRRYRQVLHDNGVVFDPHSTEFGYEFLEAMARLRVTSPERSFRIHQFIPFSLLGRAGLPAARRWLALLSETRVKNDLIHGDTLTADEVRRLVKPTLAMYGQYSPALPSARALEPLWPHARFEIVPRAGHFFPSAHPDRVIRTVREFLRQSAPLAEVV